MAGDIWHWIGFNVFILVMLALDLGVFHRNSHEVKMKEAIIWSLVWIALALSFGFLVYYEYGSHKAVEYLTGYVIEKSLSVDNIFVIVLVFSYFRVPAQYQHKVLFWGILGALVMRAIFIALGVALIQQFHWIIYVFGAFLVYTGIKLIKEEDKEIHPEHNPIIKLARKIFKVTPDFEGDKLFVVKDGIKMATPLFIVLIVVETTDLIFAVDSIPAILAITPDPYIVYTSNVFAILGLRSLYFALAGVMQMFRYLNYGLAAILSFVGVKMLLTDLYKIPTLVSLGVILLCLVVAVAASIWAERAEQKMATELETEGAE